MRHSSRLSGFTLLIGFLSLWAQATDAQTLSPVEVYKRCYIRMVRKVPLDSDPLLQDVKNGKRSADNACLTLFDNAQFTTSGVLKNRTSDDAKRVLKTFHDLHRSWLQSKVNPSSDPGAHLIRDLEEAPLYFTRAAFLPNEPFRSVVTLQQGLEGVRDQRTYPQETNNFVSQRILNYRSDMDFPRTETDLIVAYVESIYDQATKTFVNLGHKAIREPGPSVIETGLLVGVKPAEIMTFPYYRAIKTTDPELVEAERVKHVNFKVNEHFGAGIIGSQGFVNLNANLGVNQLANGDGVINRRLTSRIFEDLLCHQLPTLDDADVAAYVDPKSPYEFKHQSTCMRCHSSIDGAGYSFRNIYRYRSAANAGAGSQTVGVPVDMAARFDPVQGASWYALQPPVGRLHYRELISRTHRNISVDSVQSLGNAIAEGNDLYLCAAKRYYKFFTGVDVSLTSDTKSDLDKYHRDFVVRLGSVLKDKQRVRDLLAELFKSAQFKTRNYQTTP